jgi:hypothetical protein
MIVADPKAVIGLIPKIFSTICCFLLNFIIFSQILYTLLWEFNSIGKQGNVK